MHRLLPIMLLSLTILGCNTPFMPPLAHRVITKDAPLRVTSALASREAQRSIAVRAAQALLTTAPKARGLRFEPDPVGYVRAAWWEAGLDLITTQNFANKDMHGMAMLYQSALARGSLFKRRPKPGDLVFLGPLKTETNPFPTQVALVESVDSDGTVYALGRFSDGPRRITFDPARSNQRTQSDGKIFNDLLGNQKTTGSFFWSYGLPY
jgi:hypothetical protein